MLPAFLCSILRSCRDRLRATVCRRARLRRFAADESGASIVVICLMMPALIGAIGLAVEVSYWQFRYRAMQNAADAAVIAASTNAGSTYANEAKAVAAQYGFLDGVQNVTVSAGNPNAATGCTTGCYTVTISQNVPLYFSQVIGFRGSTTINNQPVTTLTAIAVATTTASYPYCLVALASSGAAGITANGVPNANMNGCNIMSNTTAVCHGHNLGANVANAHGNSSGCGTTQNSDVATISDPYSYLASNIPADTCGGSYPQEPSNHNDPALPLANQWSGTATTSGVKVVCGDQQLVGDTTINNTTLVIENGLTVIFTGSNSSTSQHIPTGGGTLNISAPTSGTWSGVALYQDPNLTTNVDISAAGNSPTWNISGLVYLPHSTVTLSGAVNKSASGNQCFTMVVDNITLNGTGSIFANDNQCAAQGLTQPKGGQRGTLVN